MRTTVTLDDDVARLISDVQHRERKTFTQVVNDAVRRGLGEQSVAPQRYPVRAQH